MIVIVLPKHSNNANCRYPSDNGLHEITDIAADSHGEKGTICDGVCRFIEALGLSSIIMGLLILNELMIQAIEVCARFGTGVPILAS